jgi:hypothetical protein
MSSPHGALFSDLVRLKQIKVSKADLPRFNLYGAGSERGLIQLETAGGPYNDPIEPLVVSCGSPTGPDVACSQVGTFTDRIGAYLAPRLNHPFFLVFPNLLIGQLERAPILGFQTCGSGIAVTAIPKE